ncbi:ATP-binding protein [Paenibacillus sp. RC67]|uniref:AAA family ATPase n=1 Tax=Paenibacillus sp. RC67 TaxID=3039392 RepID=UPI0024AD9CB3|nr:ATP-binding protein [Paenibacillus sp. RC67]
MFLIQMSGYPGSGKSTLAKEISKHTGAVIVDHDVVKSALMDMPGTMNSTIEPKELGGLSYHIEWSLVNFHLSLGQSVIFDSPCMYNEHLEKGIRISRKYEAQYKYIECFLNDFEELDRRLKTRERRISQISEMPALMKSTFKLTIENSKSQRPTDSGFLIVDTSQPLDSYIENVISYIIE